MSKKNKTTNTVSLDDLVCERLSRRTLMQIENLTIHSIDIIEDDENNDGDGDVRPAKSGLRMAFDTDGEQASFTIQALKIPVSRLSLRKLLPILTGVIGILYLATNSELLKSLWMLLIALAN